MASLTDLLAVAETPQPDVYIATILADIEGDGTIEMVPYGSYPHDNFGIAPQVRSAIADWINDGKPVSPYVPPTAEQLRAAMTPLTRRQLLRVLFDIGITEADVDAALSEDAVGTIEWKNANSFERLHPLMGGVAAVFNLPPEQVDSLWGYALTI
ncbi:hypothetical protein GOL81_23150 [Sinorhizobium medicae]|uniref:hypothetical protein n=1 Tax=Sinorhizobium medicae TaxID=110321 RepID=UPI000C7D3720|nr:hypothetical protein [Sinorhizobium medicae]MDX0568615.1 hypothetical protein [Sinorhizobium medicae]MDX0581271.1 hypothetical protein [Sinorhizobium medicae]MDX0784888.1 hypothetical protein [Sinorhizobium medicae]MDX0935350.1 hypothetical protein [Sinorhizobium medicae]MDX0938747.1 hypothetical protein [Sinorhizobium medicae]